MYGFLNALSTEKKEIGDRKWRIDDADSGVERTVGPTSGPVAFRVCVTSACLATSRDVVNEENGIVGKKTGHKE